MSDIDYDCMEQGEKDSELIEELTTERDNLRIQLRTAQDAAVKFAHQRDALIGLVRSLSINPTIPDGIRSLMKSALPD